MFRHSFLIALLAVSLPAFAADDSAVKCLSQEAIPPVVTKSRIVIFGESQHGTVQGPEFVGTYLCAQASAKKQVVIALEVFDSEEPLLQAFVASKGSPADVEELLTSKFWHRRFEDGKSSQAMLALMLEVQKLRARGADIQVAAFDHSFGPPVTENLERARPKVMAQNIRSTMNRWPDAQIVIMSGSAHARKTKGSVADPDYVPMALHLASERPLSFEMESTGGGRWACRKYENEKMICGPRGGNVEVDPDAHRNFRIKMNRGSTLTYDGQFFVGSTTASLPAVRN